MKQYKEYYTFSARRFIPLIKVDFTFAHVVYTCNIVCFTLDVVSTLFSKCTDLEKKRKEINDDRYTTWLIAESDQ